VLPVIDVAIVGAGPYGLSVAAHALAAGLNARVFGRPMRAWEHHMPQGMRLKSEPAASNLAASHPAVSNLAATNLAASHLAVSNPAASNPAASNLAGPGGGHSLAAYCAMAGLPHEYGSPIALADFVDYGKWFHAELVGDALDPSEVTSIRAEGDHFALELSFGRRVLAHSVVLALGFLPFARRPAALAALPPTVSTHSSDHSDLSRFDGLDVTVIGAGQSALETATLLLEAGARPRVVARATALDWNGDPEPDRAPIQRARAPHSGLGTGWKSWTCAERPGLVRRLPLAVRRHLVQTTLGPAGAWWLRERFEGRVPVLTGQNLLAAEDDLGVQLALMDRDGVVQSFHTEHVIAATGYEVDLDRVTVLEEPLRGLVRTEGRTPHLNSTFETSIPGLYMVGLASAVAFGPVMRFVYGAGFAARRVTRGLTASAASRHYRRETGTVFGDQRLNA